MLNGLLSQAEGVGVLALLWGALGVLVFFVSGLVVTQLSGGLAVRIAVAHGAGMFIRELLIQAHTFGGRRVAGTHTVQPVGVSTFGEFQKGFLQLHSALGVVPGANHILDAVAVGLQLVAAAIPGLP